MQGFGLSSFFEDSEELSKSQCHEKAVFALSEETRVDLYLFPF